MGRAWYKFCGSSRIKTVERSKAIQPKLITFIALLVFVVIILLPIISMFGNSIIGDKGISLENYAQVLSETRQLRLLFNSLVLGLGTTLLALFIGVPLGLLIGRTNIYLKKPLQYLYLVPLIIPPYMSAIAWIDLLGKRGSINLFLMKTFSLAEPFFTIYGLAGCIFILSLSYFPFVTLLTLSGLHSINHRLEEAANISHGKFSVIKKITLPLIVPHILSGAIFVFILAISNYGVPDLLRVTVFPVEIFTQFSAFYKEGIATALSLPLILITVASILLIRHYMRNRSYVTLSTSTHRSPVLELGKWKKIAFSFAFLIFVLSVILPVSDLLLKSGSIESYVTAFKTAHKQILSSVMLAAIAATTMVILGFSISYFVERSKAKGKNLVDTLSLLPFAVPATVVGIGLINIWNRPITQFIYGSSLIIIFSYVARFIPFVIRATGSSLKQIQLNLEEAALLSGGNWFRSMSKIVVPLSKPGIVAGWCLAYIFSVGELETTLLVIPPGEATLPIRIYTLMHYGANQLVAALCIILIVITLAPIIFLFLLKNLTPLKIPNDRAEKTY